jgi:5'-nucleotidase
MRLLLTNDDGVGAKGLSVLAEHVRELGEVVIVAPDTERSAVGHAITLSDPLRVSEYEHPSGLEAYSVSGTPADCVKIAVRAILSSTPDIVLSGINQGANLGTNVLYSGTVSAATEAAMLGIASAAFSLADRGCEDFVPAASFARRLAEEIHRRRLPKGVSLNVNVPPLPENQIRGVAVTRQGRIRVLEWFDKRVDPRENTYYWMAGENTLDEGRSGSDLDDAAVREGLISVTPLHYDLTSEETLHEIEGWDLQGGTFPPPPVSK